MKNNKLLLLIAACATATMLSIVFNWEIEKIASIATGTIIGIVTPLLIQHDFKFESTGIIKKILLVLGTGFCGFISALVVMFFANFSGIVFGCIFSCSILGAIITVYPLEDTAIKDND